MGKRGALLRKLFLSTLYLSAFTFGGGYVIITLMQKKFVEEYHWIEENEMLDMVAIAQSAPGPIAVNGAIIVGYKLAGAAGAAVAILGAVIPPFVIITVVSKFYDLFRDSFLVDQLLTGMQAGVGAVISSVVFKMASGVVDSKNTVSIITMVLAFAAACFLRVNVICIILVCALLGVARAVLDRRKEAGK